MRTSALLLLCLASCAGPKRAPEPAAKAAPAPEAQPTPATASIAEPPAPPPEERPPAAEPPPSKYGPPATLGHLETTPPEKRAEIDELVATLLDPMAGREAHEAKERLAEIGKPAFLPVLGRMATIRDTITDDDTMEERLVESSLMLADRCLREMDGYLDAHEKAPIRPGTDRKYIEYILRIHYRRWLDGMGSTPLKDMETMPGPFDPR